MQFKIPQNVQMEDKIVGPLTLRQLIIVGVGGGLDYMIYISMSKLYILSLTLFFVIPIALITLAIAFLKIRGIPFLQYVALAIEFYIIPKKRIWTQGSGEIFTSITYAQPKNKNQKKQEKQQQKELPQNFDSIEAITKSLDNYSKTLEENPLETREITNQG